MTRSQAELLHSLYDGELADDELSAVRARLSPEDERRLEGLTLVGSLVRTVLVREVGPSDDYDAEALFARIVAKERSELSQLDESTLQQLFDGELDEASREAALQMQADRESKGDTRVGQRLHSLASVGELVRATAARAPAYDADDLFARILEGAASEDTAVEGGDAQAARPGLRVLEGGRNDSATELKPQTSKPSHEPLDGSRDDDGIGYGWVAAAIAVAAAALLGFFLLRPSDETPVAHQDEPTGAEAEQPQRQAIQTPTPVQDDVEFGTFAGDSLDVLAQAAVDRETGRFGSEVEEVDFGSNTGAVFAVEGEHGEQYAVVWINDDEPELL